MKKKKLTVAELLFSIRNEDGAKVVRVLGMKIRMKSRMQRMRESIRVLEDKLRQHEALLRYQKQIMKIVQLHMLPSINREAVNAEVEQLRRIGINTEEERNIKVIVSLTSYPKRMYDIHLCLYSLLTQSFKPDAIVLWLAREQFPNGLEDVPQKVLNLQQWGVTIKWCEDYRSYKKLIPAIIEYPNDIIVTADDDLFYASDWLLVLWKNYLKSNRRSLIAHRCHKVAMQGGKIQPYSRWWKCIDDYSIAFSNFPTNGGGTLFPPETLHDDVKDYELASALCPSGDDIWIWGMAVRKGTMIQVVDSPHIIRYTNTAREVNLNDDGTLFQINREENDFQIARLCEQFPEIKENILKERQDTLRVSVIVPVYNAAATLRKCLDSLVAQTLDKIEVICVNDGSTDASERIMRGYAAKYANIQILTQPNKGAAAARNVGIQNASGDYIAFVDSDDYISSDYLELLYKSATRAHAEIAATDQVIICEKNKAGRRKDVGISPDTELITTIEDKGKIIITTGVSCNKIYKRDFLNRNKIYYPELNCTGEDNYFTAFAMLYAKRIGVNHEATYYYVMHETSQTHVRKLRKDFAIIDFYKRIELRILGLQIDDIGKRTWLHIINERKKKDYHELCKLLEEEDRILFRAKADEHLSVRYL